MGRRKRQPNKATEARRERATRLEEQGKTSREIATILGVSLETVRRYLRATRGAKMPVTADIERLLDAGVPHPDIARALKVTIGHVDRVARERRGTRRGYVPAAQRIPVFLAAPKKCLSKDWAKTESFGDELLLEGFHSVNSDPVKAADIVNTSIEFFSALLEVRRTFKTRRTTRCHLVQAYGSSAHRFRAIERAAEALEVLVFARSLADGCIFCRADLDRRQAVVLRDLTRYREAHHVLARAKGVYSASQQNGHDLMRNGPGNCAFAEVGIRIFEGRLSTAIIVAEKAVETVSPDISGTLFVSLWHALAFALFKRREPGDLERAASLCEQHLDRFGDEPNQNHVKLSWLRAKLLETEGNIDAAVLRLEDALWEVIDLELPAGVAAIVSDIERLRPDSTSFRRRIEDLMSESEHGDLPEWLEPIRDAIDKALRMARTDLPRALATLRREGGGDRFIAQIA